MTYGARIYNSSGQVVIDDTEPTYLLTATFTANGTQSSFNNTLYDYNFSSFPLLTFPAFVNLNVGEFLGAGGGGFLSTQSSLQFLSLKPANEIADPSGYDVVFYNAQGQKTWMASSSVVLLNSFGSIPVNGSFASDADYVALISRLPFFARTGAQGIRIAVSVGVERISPTTYNWAGRGLGLAPDLEVGPFPVSCIFAKSN